MAEKKGSAVGLAAALGPVGAALGCGGAGYAAGVAAAIGPVRRKGLKASAGAAAAGGAAIAGGYLIAREQVKGLLGDEDEEE